MRHFFPAKVLLFGEHRVLRGARALAAPLPSLGVWWCRKNNSVDQDLLRFSSFLANQFSSTMLQWPLLRRDILRGWQLRSDVPFGYGLGSSGTVCAAIC